MVGLGDSQTDERVAAVVVINPNKKTNMEDLLKWCNENMQEAEVIILMMVAMLCFMIMTKMNFAHHCIVEKT